MEQDRSSRNYGPYLIMHDFARSVQQLGRAKIFHHDTLTYQEITTRQSTILVPRFHATKIKDEYRILLFKLNQIRLDGHFSFFKSVPSELKSSDNVIVLFFVYEYAISNVMLFMITMSQKNLMTNRNLPTLILVAPKKKISQELQNSVKEDVIPQLSVYTFFL